MITPIAFGKLFKSIMDKAEGRIHRSGRPLCDVTRFRGPNGAFSVSQDGDLWVVDKGQPRGVFPQADQTNIKTIFPRDPGDTHAGTFLGRTNAMDAARNWAGAEVEPIHPIPNRRAAIAHSRAKSCG